MPWHDAGAVRWRCDSPMPRNLIEWSGLSGRYGPWIVVLARPLPILAEASVLLLGVHHLAWRRFLPAVLLSNLGIALAYSGFGNFAKEQQWLPGGAGVFRRAAAVDCNCNSPTAIL